MTGRTPDDPYLVGVVEGGDNREIAEAAGAGAEDALGRPVHVDLTRYHRMSARETGIGLLYWARLNRDNEAFTMLRMGEEDAVTEGSPAMASLTDERGGPFRYQDLYHGLDYRFTDLHAGVLGSFHYFGPAGRGRLVELVDDRLGRHLPGAADLGALPVVLHEFAHVDQVDAIRRGRPLPPGLSAEDFRTRVELAWNEGLAAGPAGVPPAFRRPPEVRVSPFAGALSPLAHVPPSLSAATDDGVRGGAFRPYAAERSYEGHADALMDVMIAGPEANWLSTALVAETHGERGVREFAAASRWLRAAMGFLRDRVDPRSGERAHRSVSVHVVRGEVLRRGRSRDGSPERDTRPALPPVPARAGIMPSLPGGSADPTARDRHLGSLGFGPSSAVAGHRPGPSERPRGTDGGAAPGRGRHRPPGLEPRD